jgi:peptidoglycan/LPS O-acetylase OafA/YrhL
MEVVLYILFFIFASLLSNRWPVRFAAVAGMIAIATIIHALNKLHWFGMPMLCFYAGGAAYLLWQRMHEKGWSPKLVGAVALIVLAASIATSFVYFTETMLYSVVFSAVVFGLVLIQDASPSFGRRAKVIGDISYSTYLLHFPVTLLLVLLNKAGWTSLNFDLGSIWLLYFAIVIGLAVPTYYKFEMPTQNRLRRLMLRPDVAPDIIVPELAKCADIINRGRTVLRQRSRGSEQLPTPGNIR